jgi:hypothetical protein
MKTRLLTGMFCWLAAVALAAEPIQLIQSEATFFAGSSNDFVCVVDGVETGPRGWSVFPETRRPHALIARCARPVEAAELDIALFFLAGRPLHTIAEFGLSYTTDAEPSLQGNWQPLEIQRFSAEVTTLRRTPEGRLRAEPLPQVMTGTIPDDVYRVAVLLPGGRATGFRLDVFPVQPAGSGVMGLSWSDPPFDFCLTEFRVAVQVRETTNIALHRPSKPVIRCIKGWFPARSPTGCRPRLRIPRLRDWAPIFISRLIWDG